MTITRDVAIRCLTKNQDEYIARFGTIGQGPAELPSPCYGYLTESGFSVFDDQTRIVDEIQP